MKKTLLGSMLVTAMLVTGCTTTTSVPPVVVSDTDVTSFTDISAHISQLNARYGTDKVLIVTDIDNTLLTSTSDLGSDIWYQWQAGKLALKPQPDQQVDCLYADAIGLLYELAPQQLIEPGTPQLLARWQHQGNHVVALTARSPSARAATERELARAGMDFTQTPLTTTANTQLMINGVNERPYTYLNGIMMTSGQHKGHMLQTLLDKAGETFQAIVFIDDSEKNVSHMTEAYESRGNTSLTAFHYTLVEERRVAQFGAVLTPQQADTMASQWQALNRTLNDIYPARDKQGSCLTPL